MTKRSICPALLVAFIVFPLRADEFKLISKQVDGTPYEETVRNMARPATLVADPSSIKGAPGDLASGAFYASTALAGGVTFNMLLDPARVPGLYVDSNRNSDLSDDTRIDGKIISNRPGIARGLSVACFNPVSIPLPGAEPSSLKTAVEVYGAGLVRVRQAAVMTGDIAIDGRRQPCALLDYDFDGSYHTFEGGKYCDMLLTDADRSGTLEPAECRILSKLIQTDRGYSSIEVSADGSSIRIEKVDPKLASLSVDPPGSRITAFSDNGCYLTLGGPSGKWQVPVGEYRPLAIGLTAKGTGGEWSLDGAFNSKDRVVVAVPENGSGTLAVGPPLTILIDVGIYRGQVVVWINGLKGKAGEVYSPTVKRNGASAPAPAIRILDESNKVLASDVMKYG